MQEEFRNQALPELQSHVRPDLPRLPAAEWWLHLLLAALFQWHLQASQICQFVTQKRKEQSRLRLWRQFSEKAKHYTGLPKQSWSVTHFFVQQPAHVPTAQSACCLSLCTCFGNQVKTVLNI